MRAFREATTGVIRTPGPAHAEMIRRHETHPGEICANCRHFARRASKQGRAIYPKCRLYGIDPTRLTDWGFGWPACGLFAQRRTP